MLISLLLALTAHAEIEQSTLLTPTFKTTQASPEITAKLQGTYAGVQAGQVPTAPGTPNSALPTSGSVGVPEAGYSSGSNISSGGLSSVPQ